MTATTKRTVLIVDDEPIACDMMAGFLVPDGYDLVIAHTGPEALARIEKHPPDVVLLDVMMPEMDGFDVCLRLKGDKRWRHIPIILVTALGGKDNLVRGFDAGADDFVYKPVDNIELRARVRSLMRIKEQYDELEDMLTLREDMTHMIVHDIRTPLTAILGLSELLLVRSALSPVDSKDIKAIQIQAYRLNAFLNDMLILAKLEAERLILNRSMVDINQLLSHVKDSYDVVAQSKRIKLVTNLPAQPQQILLDANLFQRVLENLLSNALKYSPIESTITLRVEYPGAKTMLHSSVPRARIEIIDEGPGISEENRERIFDKFEIVKLKEPGEMQMGLGLAFCKMVVEAHGGYIFVKPNQATGSIFTIEV